MSIVRGYVRKKVEDNNYYFTGHALQRMGERMITTDQVIAAILNGQEIEIQKFENKDVRILFQEATEEIPEFYVVVAASYPCVAVLSVVRFEEEAWEFVGNVARRMKK